MIDSTVVLFALIACLAFTVQTAVGFASTLLCVTLGAHVLPIRQVVALAVLMSFVQTAYVVLRHRGGVEWRMLGARILPAMALGGALGFWGVRELAGSWAEPLFAGLVTLLAGRELIRMVRAPGDERPIPRPAANLITGLAGVVHGAYATGGPLLVYAVGRELPKRQLRATLSFVWLVMDGALMTSFAADGAYTRASLGPLALVPLALPLGVTLGELAHRKVDEQRFKLGLFALLFLAGLSLFIRS